MIRPAARAAVLVALLAALMPAGMQAQAQVIDTEAGPMQARALVTGLNEPWAVDTLPDGTVLITERPGRLLAVEDGRARAVDGLPEVWGFGQGGLLDILVPRDFAVTRALFFTYARPTQGGAAGTAVLRARLSEDGARLEDVRDIFVPAHGSTLGRHFGSRLVEATDGTLFFTIGDRGDPDTAQDRGMHNGSVLRIAKDGSVPGDNPFVGTEGVQPEIWSTGHRNAQGAALAPDGTLWTVEHGARGGDEVNRVARGANYGWPVITYGVDYDGSRIGRGTEAPGMEQPVFYWDPSIAPSGLAFYDGGAVPEWQGDAFTGSLNSDMIIRLDGATMQEAERIRGPQTARVRDVTTGPDGTLWFLSVGDGALYSLAPAQGG